MAIMGKARGWVWLQRPHSCFLSLLSILQLVCALFPLLCHLVPSRALSRGALWWPVAWKALVSLKETGFPNGSVVKNPLANAGDAGSIPGLRRSPGEGHGNPLQYSCLENNTVDRGAWWAPWGHERVNHDLATKQQLCF